MMGNQSPPASEAPARIGVVGAGYIANGFVNSLEHHSGLQTSCVLTRRDPSSVRTFDHSELLTTSLEELLDRSDLIVECTGDPIYATEAVDAALRASLPVVTMDAEFQVTAGSYFVGKGRISEAEGDQPGSQAALAEDVREMGFRPLVYGNMKAFLNLTPTPEEMELWARKQGYSLEMTTSFTDGTKVNVEQTLVANGLGAAIAEPGLLAPEVDDLEAGAALLAERARALGAPISDYVLSAGSPHGVFVVAEHDGAHRDALEHYKFGPGPNYVIVKPGIAGYLEIVKTVKRMLRGEAALLDNGREPTVSVATIAKRDLPAGTRIERGLGSFDVRGIAVTIDESAGHAPIGLVRDAVLKRPLRAGDMLALDDLELPDSLALRAWSEIETRALAAARQPAPRALA